MCGVASFPGVPDSVLIPHVDDVACAHGANVAFFALLHAGAVTCGSVMVPCAWFPEAAARARDSGADLGIHLTLTSESAAHRWRPLSTTDPASGLLDPAGYLWRTVPELRANADPDAVEAELRAQVEAARRAGIDVTHLDHHMGAAVSPEFVAGTVRVARDYGLPVLFPADLDGYLAVLNMGEVDAGVLERAREAAGALAFGDTFLMPLVHEGRADHEAALREMLADPPPGVSYLSLHTAAPGDVEAVHPKDAAWRLGEYAVFSDAGFVEWLAGRVGRVAGMRDLRDRL